MKAMPPATSPLRTAALLCALLLAGAAACAPTVSNHGHRMDMTVVDLTAAPELAEGDWVEADYALPQAAEVSGLSQYELLTLLGRRFSR